MYFIETNGRLCILSVFVITDTRNMQPSKLVICCMQWTGIR